VTGVEDSVAFDRAAEFYDRTRAITDETMARNVELLTVELAGRGRVLEVGVGTGLLALPLHEGGLELVGVDLSAPMLRKLVEKAGGRPPFPLALGDATRMPFDDDAFGAAYLRWVLHLIPAWRDALAEMVRVVRPGGVVLVNLGAYGGERLEIQRRFAELTGVSVEPVGLGWGEFDALDRAMEGLGATPRALPEVHEAAFDSLEDFLDGIEESRYSWTWGVPDDVRLGAVADLRPWAQQRFGRLDEATPRPHATRWAAFDLA
jgi:ubiquinone/menaquinone biosynthesis C-methylase UbiE